MFNSCYIHRYTNGISSCSSCRNIRQNISCPIHQSNNIDNSNCTNCYNIYMQITRQLNPNVINTRQNNNQRINMLEARINTSYNSRINILESRVDILSNHRTRIDSLYNNRVNILESRVDILSNHHTSMVESRINSLYNNRVNILESRINVLSRYISNNIIVNNSTIRADITGFINNNTDILSRRNSSSEIEEKYDDESDENYEYTDDDESEQEGILNNTVNMSFTEYYNEDNGIALSIKNINCYTVPYIFIDENSSSICVICQHKYIKNDINRSLDCNHTFHLTCIDKWFENHNNCPLCNQIFE
jgi:3-dehydroquinate dehydratase